MSFGWRARSSFPVWLGRLVLTLLVALIGGSGVADPLPSKTVSSEPNRNYKVSITLLGYSDSPVRKQSGTNAVFTGGAQVVGVQYSGPSPAWTRAYVTSLEVEVGFHLRSWASQPGVYPSSKTFDAQWDTTAFAHSASVPVKLRTRMRLDRLAPPEPGAEPQVVESEEVSLDLEVDVQAWNKALVMGTRESVVGHVPPQPVKPLYDYAAKQGVTDALPRFINMMHGVDPASVQGALNLDRSNFAAKVQSSTVLYLFTHGAVDSFRVSGLVQPDEDNFVYTTDLADWVPTGDDFPEMNLAIFYACDMLIGGDFGIATRILTPTGQIRTNRAILGFGDKVLSVCYIGDGNPYEIEDPTLDLHSAELLAQLENGETAERARTLARDMYIPASGNGELAMDIAGDIHARLRGL